MSAADGSTAKFHKELPVLGAAPAPVTPRARSSKEAEKIRRALLKTMLRTVTEFGLIEDGDRILVAISGGKDSYTMLDLLSEARRKAPVSFELVAFHLDQAQPGYDGRPLANWLESFGSPFEIHHEDTYSTVIDIAEREKTSFCAPCSRLRRGILYTNAERLGCNKIALGHHRDDALETLLLNQFYSGRIQAMPAKYRTNDDRFDVIRPLIECAESDIATHAVAAAYPILPCNLCGSQADLKRQTIARLLDELEKQNPPIRQVLLASLKNVRPTHLLDAEVCEAWLEASPRYEPRK